MRARFLIVLAVALLLSACGSRETRLITYALARAQERQGDVPVKLLAAAHPSRDELLLFYQYRKEKLGEERCGSGAILVRPGHPEQWLDEEHACATGDVAISFGRAGALGDHTLTYGLVFDARVARVAVAYGDGTTTDASLSGGTWWILGQAPAIRAPREVSAFDRAGKPLLKVMVGRVSS